MTEQINLFGEVQQWPAVKAAPTAGTAVKASDNLPLFTGRAESITLPDIVGPVTIIDMRTGNPPRITETELKRFRENENIKGEIMKTYEIEVRYNNTGRLENNTHYIKAESESLAVELMNEDNFVWHIGTILSVKEVNSAQVTKYFVPDGLGYVK